MSKIQKYYVLKEMCETEVRSNVEYQREQSIFLEPDGLARFLRAREFKTD